MAVTYRIDPGRRRIVTVCEGNTTLPDVLAHFDELDHDEQCPLGADVLLDLSKMTTVPNVGQIQSAADRAGATSRRVRFGAIAIVVDSGDIFGMARVFSTFTQRFFTRSGVFPTRAAAENWLEATASESGSPRKE